MNELDLDVTGQTLDEIHAAGLVKAAVFYGVAWKPSLIRCEARPLVRAVGGRVLRYEAMLTYRGVPQAAVRRVYPWSNGPGCSFNDQGQMEWMAAQMRLDGLDARVVLDRPGGTVLVWVDLHGNVWSLDLNATGRWEITDDGALHLHSIAIEGASGG